MKSRYCFLRTLLSSLALAANAAQAATVFFDDFNDPNGTLLDGKSPDIGGGNWSVTDGAATLDIQDGILDTTGARREVFGFFSEALGSEQPILLLTLDVTLLSGFNGGGSLAGFSLFAGTTEGNFAGDRSGETGGWGLEIAGGGQSDVSDLTETGLRTIRYDFNTGITELYGNGDASGTPEISLQGVAGQAFDRVRFLNDNGGDLALSSVQVDVVPEPSGMLLSACGLAGLLVRRRRN